jgi:hypothetical protein
MAGKVYDENKYLIDFRNNFADRVMEKLDLWQKIYKWFLKKLEYF